MMWKCIWMKSLVNLGRTCLMKERCTTWKTWFWQFLGFQKMTEKLQHSNLWNDVKMHMIEVSWASEANLSHERKVYNLAERKMVRYCQNVHWCMSQYLKMSWMPLCVWTTLHFWNECVDPSPLGNKTKVEKIFYQVVQFLLNTSTKKFKSREFSDVD